MPKKFSKIHRATVFKINSRASKDTFGDEMKIQVQKEDLSQSKISS